MTNEELRVLYVKSNQDGFLDFEKFAKLVNNSFEVNYPTADEVCKALSEWLKKEISDLWNYKVYHDDGGFHYNNNEDYEIYLVDYDEVFGRIFFPRYLPPHLITLIGRFYGGIEE